MAKLIESYNVNDYEILTDTGWVDITAVHKTIPYKVCVVYTDNFEIECADEHIVFDENYNEVFVKDLKLGDKIITENGPEIVFALNKMDDNPIEHMYDLTVAGNNHRFFSNGILSHNSTIYSIFSLYYCFYNAHKKILMVANKEATVKEILSRVKFAYSKLPNWLKLGVTKWSAKQIEFENGSSISVCATSPDSARGSSCDVCLNADTWVTILENNEIHTIPILDLLEISNIVDNINEKNKPSFEDLLKFEINRPVPLDLRYLCNLDELEHNTKLKQQLEYHTLSGNSTIPVCPICGKKMYTRFRNHKYYSTCSVSCSKKLLKNYKDLNPEYIGAKILTPYGFERFDGIAKNYSDTLIEVKTKNFSLFATPDHRFKISTDWNIIDNCEGYRLASELKYNDKLLCNGYITPINSVKRINGKFTVFDVINAGKHHCYITNGAISHNCIIDEVAFIPDSLMSEFVASVFPTIASRPEGKIILVSTPNGNDNFFAKTWQQAIYKQQDGAIGDNKNTDDDLNWKPVFFPWWEHPERDERWAKKQRAMLQDERRFKTEFECCFLGSSNTLFDPSVLEFYKKHVLDANKDGDPFEVEHIKGREIHVYEKPIPKHVYSMGVDIGDGTGIDWSVIHIIDITDASNLKVVCTFGSNTISPYEFSYLIAKLGARYNYALIAGERNGVGASVFDTLWNIFEYENIISYISDDKPYDKIGIYSTNKNKSDACLFAKSLLIMGASNDHPQLNFSVGELKTVYEMEGFESRLIGNFITYTCGKNKHDDFIMSMIWGLFPLKMLIAEQFFNIKKTFFTEYGLEVPCLLENIQTNVNYSEEIVDRISAGEGIINQNYIAEKEQRSRTIVQDAIFNEFLNNDDNW